MRFYKHKLRTILGSYIYKKYQRRRLNDYLSFLLKFVEMKMDKFRNNNLRMN